MQDFLDGHLFFLKVMRRGGKKGKNSDSRQQLSFLIARTTFFVGLPFRMGIQKRIRRKRKYFWLGGIIFEMCFWEHRHSFRTIML